MKAFTYNEFTDKSLVESEIPADMLEKAQRYRSLLIENAVAEDEAMLEKYLEVGEDGLTVEESSRLSVRLRSVVNSTCDRW